MSNRPYVACTLVALVLLPAAASADAADVTITDATIAAGKLVITGTASPGSWVRLDGQAGSAYNVKSGADGGFSFGVVYHPGDCVVELQKVVSPTTVGEATEALVANCGPAGLTPRGAWSAKAAYATNDLVTYEGSTFRAKRNNAGSQPGVAATWEVFAAKGDSGEGTDAQASRSGGDGTLVEPTGPAGGDLEGTYPNPGIRYHAVTSAKLENLAVTTAKIADGAVTKIKIAEGAIGTARLADTAVSTAKIADGAVTGVKILDGSVSGDDIASSSLTGIDVANSSLTGSDILDESLGSSDVADGSITTADLAISSVTSSRIAASAVTSSEVANRSLTTDDIDLAERSGSISVNAISNGRCATITGSVSGARPGDVAMLTTNGSLPSGMLIYAQRALTDAIHIKVCNLTGATSAAISDLPVRVLTFH